MKQDILLITTFDLFVVNRFICFTVNVLSTHPTYNDPSLSRPSKCLINPIRDLLNKLIEITTISVELEAVQVKDVRDTSSVVEEAGVVRNNDWNIKY
jgi:hypothetical protein